MTEPLSPPSYPIDHLARRGASDAPALLVGDTVMTFAELDAGVGRLASWLLEQTGDPGERVASWSAKTRTACLMPLAVARAGLIHVPVNPLLKAPQAAHILADSGARLLVTNAARAASLGEGLSESCVVQDLKIAEEVIDSGGEGLPPSLAKPGDLASILYTSGSTGRPKGVMLSHANLWLGAESVASYLNLVPDDRILAVLPLSFDYGQNQLLSTWYAGGAVAPLDYLTPRDVVKAVARHRATTLAGVPPLWVQLVESDWPAQAAGQLKRLTNSGGALTPSLIDAMRRTFPAADVYPMYGLTEAFRSTWLDPALVADHPTSMGRAIPPPMPRYWSAAPTEASPPTTSRASSSIAGRSSRKAIGTMPNARRSASVRRRPHRPMAAPRSGRAIRCGATPRGCCISSGATMR